MKRLYPLVAGLMLLFSALTCDNGITDSLNDTSQMRAWCGTSTADVCVTP